MFSLHTMWFNHVTIQNRTSDLGSIWFFFRLTYTRTHATTATNKPNVKNLWCISMKAEWYWAAATAGSHICDTENRSDLTNMGIAIVQIDATISSGVLFSCLHTNSIYLPLSIAHAMLMRAKIFIISSTFWAAVFFSCWFSVLRCNRLAENREREKDEERITTTAHYFIIHQCELSKVRGKNNHECIWREPNLPCTNIEQNILIHFSIHVCVVDENLN